VIRGGGDQVSGGQWAPRGSAGTTDSLASDVVFCGHVLYVLQIVVVMITLRAEVGVPKLAQRSIRRQIGSCQADKSFAVLRLWPCRREGNETHEGGIA